MRSIWPVLALLAAQSRVYKSKFSASFLQVTRKLPASYPQVKTLFLSFSQILSKKRGNIIKLRKNRAGEFRPGPRKNFEKTKVSPGKIRSAGSGQKNAPGSIARKISGGSKVRPGPGKSGPGAARAPAAAPAAARIAQGPRDRPRSAAAQLRRRTAAEISRRRPGPSPGSAPPRLDKRTTARRKKRPDRPRLRDQPPALDSSSGPRRPTTRSGPGPEAGKKHHARSGPRWTVCQDRKRPTLERTTPPAGRDRLTVAAGRKDRPRPTLDRPSGTGRRPDRRTVARLPYIK